VAHRWLGLAAALFWLVQAVTGMVIIFHWELRDLASSSIHRATDLPAIERRIASLNPSQGQSAVQSVWTTAGLPDRYDISFVDLRGSDATVTIAGDGTILRGADDQDDLLSKLVLVHHDLLAGEAGEWIVGISGLLLLSNLAMGLVIGWPRRGTWSMALRMRSNGPSAARLYSWHRALGLWLALPALLIVATGTMLRFGDGLKAYLGAEEPAPPVLPSQGSGRVGFARAAAAGLAAIPGSTLTAVSFPSDGGTAYRVRVRAPGEIARAYGASLIFVDAASGRVSGVFPIAEARGGRVLMSALFPIHTGEAAGLPGRLFAILIGGWLVGMTTLGVLLWRARRRSRVPR